MKKDCMFQYYYDNGVFGSGYSYSCVQKIEDTGLITYKEAQKLWEKYYPDVVKKLEEDKRPQMCLWKDACNDIDYSTVDKEIDWRDDLEIENGAIYKKVLIKIT